MYSLTNGLAPATWMAAEATCRSLGGSLASVHTRAENDFIFSLGASMKQLRWLGARRVPGSTAPAPFTWAWSDNTTFSIFGEYASCTQAVDCLWLPNEPSGLAGEECVQMGLRTSNGAPDAKPDGGWNDANCGFARNFVCKRRVSQCPAAIAGLDTDAVAACPFPALVGDVCTAQCSAGHQASGEPGYRCDASGSWVGGSLVCSGPTCGVLEGPANTVTAHCIETQAPDACTVRCAPGYVEAIGSQPNYTCGWNGTWTGGSMQCQVRDCGALDAAALNATSTCTGTLVNATCAVSCMSGYTGAEATFVCGEQGKWERVAGSAPLECRIRDCGSTLPSLPGTDSACIPSTFGSTCQASCVAGYQPVSADMVGVYTCGAEGRWEGGSLQCERISCGQPVLSPDRNVLLAAACNGTRFGDRCDVVCRAGFAVGAGVQDITCQSDGRWSEPAECLPVQCPATLPLSPAGSVSVTCARRQFGDQCVGSCGARLAVEGQAVFTCGKDGAWTGGCFECSPWQTFGASQYFWSKDSGVRTATWAVANQTCVAMGAQLASIETPAENLFVYGLDPVYTTLRWLGGFRPNDNGTAVAPNFPWQWSNGQPFALPADAAYANCTPGVSCLWMSGEPNNWRFSEYCLGIGHPLVASNPGSWNDAPCSAQRHFVCERPAMARTPDSCLPPTTPTTTSVTAAVTESTSAPSTTADTTSTSTVAATTTTTAMATTTPSTAGSISSETTTSPTTVPTSTSTSSSSSSTPPTTVATSSTATPTTAAPTTTLPSTTTSTTSPGTRELMNMSGCGPFRVDGTPDDLEPTRFTNAFTNSSVLSLTTVDHYGTDVGNATSQCMCACRARLACRGIFVQLTSTQVACRLMASVGGMINTRLVAFSMTKLDG